jgi:hypothetical protein
MGGCPAPFQTLCGVHVVQGDDQLHSLAQVELNIICLFAWVIRKASPTGERLQIACFCLLCSS